MSPRCTSTSPVAVAGQRSWIRPRAVDQVEEDELPHVAPREHPAREAPQLRRLRAGLERPRPRRGRLRSRRGRESAWRHAASLWPDVPAHRPGVRAILGRPALRDDLEPVLAVEGRFASLFVSSSARDAVGAGRSMPGCRSAVPMPCRARRSARRRSRRGTSAAPARPRRASPRRRGRRRRSARSPTRARSGVATRARSSAPTWICGRPGGSQRARRGTSPAVVHTSASVTSKPTRKSQGRSAARRRALGSTHSHAGSS